MLLQNKKLIFFIYLIACFAGVAQAGSPLFSDMPSQPSYGPSGSVTSYTCNKALQNPTGNFRLQNYLMLDNWLQRISGIQNNSYLAFRTFVFRSGVISTQIVQVERVTSPYLQEWQLSSKPSQTKPAAQEARQSLEETALQSVNFTLNHYKNRRDWPEEFHDKLRKLALEYLEDSTYINLYEGPYVLNDHDRRMVATLRLIRPLSHGDHKGLLPLEEYLGVHLPKEHAKTKIEPGNFSINKELNGEAFAELLLHMLAEAPQSEFYTYADRLSFLMYQRLGFQPVAGFEAIEKNGVKWTVLHASAQDLKKVLENISEFKSVADDELKLALQVRASQIDRSKLLNPYTQTTHVVTGTNFTMKGMFQHPKEAAISAVRNRVEEGYILLAFNSTDDSSIREVLLIPESDFPLQEGKVIHGRHGRRSYESCEMTYQNGAIIAKWGLAGQAAGEMRIEASPDLKMFHQVELKTFHENGKPQYEMKADF